MVVFPTPPFVLANPINFGMVVAHMEASMIGARLHLSCCYDADSLPQANRPRRTLSAGGAVKQAMAKAGISVAAAYVVEPRLNGRKRYDFFLPHRHRAGW